MKTHSETRTLPTELSPEELAEESKKLATAVEEVAKQKDAIAEKTGLWRETKKKMEGYLGHLEEEMNALAEVVDSGMADREVACSWLYALGAGYAFLIRDDTGELVLHRRLGDGERQTELLEVLREPTAEQLAGWVESLGLVLDPQADLPLAEPEMVYYYRDFTLASDTAETGEERITGRFTEADHRTASLAGVHVHRESAAKGGLPEQIDRAILLYDDSESTLQHYRRALEEILEAKKTEALRNRREPSEGETAAEPKRGRKGK